MRIFNKQNPLKGRGRKFEMGVRIIRVSSVLLSGFSPSAGRTQLDTPEKIGVKSGRQRL
jgi:hypothetical protein